MSGCINEIQNIDESSKVQVLENQLLGELLLFSLSFTYKKQGPSSGLFFYTVLDQDLGLAHLQSKLVGHHDFYQTLQNS